MDDGTPGQALKTAPPVPPAVDWAHIMDLHGAYERSALLHAAIELDLFTHLAHLEAQSDGMPIPAAAVAARAGTDPRATELAMNALVSLGLLLKEAPDDPESPFPGGAFRTTPLAQRHLIEGSDEDFRAFIRFDAANWSTWGDLAGILRRGGPKDLDHMYQNDPAATKRFIDAMDAIGRARGDVPALARRIDLSRAVHLLDVGGGSAAYSLAFLAANPHLHVTLIDLPQTLKVTQEYVDKAPEGVRRRINLVPCDYTKDPIPKPPATSSLPEELITRLKLPDELLPKLSEGYDVAWVSNIVHGEDPDENRALAKKLHDALRPGGRVIIKDHILDATLTTPAVGGIFGVTMLLFTKGGRCYGFDEVRRWYEDAGFVDLRETPPQPPLTSSLVTARRPGGGLHEEISRAAKLFGENVSGFVKAFETGIRGTRRER